MPNRQTMRPCPVCGNLCVGTPDDTDRTEYVCPACGQDWVMYGEADKAKRAEDLRTYHAPDYLRSTVAHHNPVAETRKRSRVPNVLLFLLVIAVIVGFFAFRAAESQLQADSNHQQALVLATTEVSGVNQSSMPLDQRYYYGTLSAEDQKLYQMMYDAAILHEGQVLFSDAPDLTEAFVSMRADCPELFFLQPTYSSTITTSQAATRQTTALSFFCDDATAKLQTQQLHTVATEILAGMDSTWSDAVKVTYLHDSLCAQSTYSFEAADDTSRDPAYAYQQTAYGALVQGSAVCEGYAEAFEYLCYRAGLPCRVVVGQGITEEKQETHAWNQVLIDGEWLNIDATWDDQDQIPAILHDYLLVPDAEFAQTHIEESLLTTIQAI